VPIYRLLWDKIQKNRQRKSVSIAGYPAEITIWDLPNTLLGSMTQYPNVMDTLIHISTQVLNENGCKTILFVVVEHQDILTEISTSNNFTFYLSHATIKIHL